MLLLTFVLLFVCLLVMISTGHAWGSVTRCVFGVFGGLSRVFLHPVR